MSISHEEMVKALVKPGEQIIQDLTPGLAHILHMAIGISGEAGEIIDAVKKAAIYNRDIDTQNLIEELGDLEFYMEGLRQGLGVSRRATLDANIQKLGKRYAGYQYSNEAAVERADKRRPAEGPRELR